MQASPSSKPLRLAIIGGGITGLAAAHRMLEIAPHVEVTIFEASDRVGGILATQNTDGYLVERAADMFSTKEPWALDLCNRIGFGGELINTNQAHRRAFIVRHGRLQPVPDGFTLMAPTGMWPVFKTPLLSWRGKLRLAGERFVPRPTNHSDESLQGFATRRLGREAYERLAQPLIGGIYTADPTKLSMQAALPEIVEMERQHGSLTRAARAKGARHARREAGARYGLFVAPRRGMGSLVEAIRDRLPEKSVRLNARVEQAGVMDGHWHLRVAKEPRAHRFDALIVATPAYRASRILVDTSPELAQELDEIPYAGVAVVLLGYRRDQIAHPLDGFGFVVPLIEQRRLLSVSFSSVKFEGRAPTDRVLLRVFIGGACQAELVELPDAELFSLATSELSSLIGATGEPELRELVRWRNAMPQYHVGHRDRVERIWGLASQLPRLALSGNAYEGVGIPFCIHSGELAAERIAAMFVHK